MSIRALDRRSRSAWLLNRHPRSNTVGDAVTRTFFRKRSPHWGVVTAWVAVFSIAVVAIGVSFYWTWLSSGESNSSTIRNLVLIVATVIALPFAIWRSTVAERQAETAHRSLLNERYQKGADMLGSPVATVRRGGIFALQRLANEHNEFHVPIMRLFCAFVRNPTKETDKELADTRIGQDRATTPAADVAAVMDAIGARQDRSVRIEARAEFVPDLRHVRLCSASLANANLSNAWLSGAKLKGAALVRADMSNAILNQADLSGARLDGAVIRGATLHRTKLQGAAFWTPWPPGRLRFTTYLEAVQEGKVIAADFSSSRLDYADFSHASMEGVDLSGCDLTNSMLSDAKLANVNFARAILKGANLSNAVFSCNGKLAAKGLIQQQLDAAVADADNPPALQGVMDAKTGQPLVWRGKDTK